MLSMNFIKWRFFIINCFFKSKNQLIKISTTLLSSLVLIKKYNLNKLRVNLVNSASRVCLMLDNFKAKFKRISNPVSPCKFKSTYRKRCTTCTGNNIFFQNLPWSTDRSLSNTYTTGPTAFSILILIDILSSFKSYH